MKAVVMAGGVGSRLRPLTIERPKPMVPLVNKPVMAHILDLLKRHNITEVVVTLQYLATLIQDYFSDGSSLGMKIHYRVEETPLGTAGSVKRAQDLLDDTFLVISGDAVTNIDLRKVVEFHRARGALATLALYSLDNPVEYGVITTDEEGRILRFQEKPSRGSVMSDRVNTGIYVLEPEILDYFAPDTPFDFARDLFPMIHEQKKPLYGFTVDGYWCDVGNIPEYMRANADALLGKIEGLNLGQYLGNGIWVGKDVEISPDAHLEGPVYLGNAVQIKGGAVIKGPSVIRDYTVIDHEAVIDRSILWRNCYIGERAQISGAVITRQCSVKNNATIFEGAVIGDGTIIGEGAIIHSSVKIWPGKEVEPGATVNASIIWGSQGRRVLFGRFGITGVVNIDLTPEFGARIGAAFGAILPKGSTVTINRDMHRSPQMIKRAIISGLPSAGVNVWDLGSQPIPVARYFTRISDVQGGVHVRLSPFDQRVVDIRFMDSQGLNLSKTQERTVEHIFFREDFRRVYLDDIGKIEYALHANERYIEDFLHQVNTRAIQEAGFELVVAYADVPVSNTLSVILDKLHCNVVSLNSNANSLTVSAGQSQYQSALKQLQIISTALGAQLGVRLDAGGESIVLVDDRGYLLQGITAFAALAELALRDAPGSTIAVPVNMPLIFEKIAQKYNGKVIRTEIDANSFVEATCTHKVILAGDGAGSFIFPDFHCAFDGMMALVKTLEYLATQNCRLGEVVENLPPYHLAQRRVSCTWEAKGRVMRQLNEKFRPAKSEILNGIKLDLGPGRWVLIVPDPDHPYFRITVEAESQKEAEALADKYTRIVEEVVPLE
ncbi:MAG: nucleotidyl transferase [Chloroflexi bacterium]|nr:MAG: nucleotidyl transferase [Chloroflexota bacterium]